jgi:hypothetical protein
MKTRNLQAFDAPKIADNTLPERNNEMIFINQFNFVATGVDSILAIYFPDTYEGGIKKQNLAFKIKFGGWGNSRSMILKNSNINNHDNPQFEAVSVVDEGKFNSNVKSDYPNAEISSFKEYHVLDPNNVSKYSFSYNLTHIELCVEPFQWANCAQHCISYKFKNDDTVFTKMFGSVMSVSFAQHPNDEDLILKYENQKFKTIEHIKNSNFKITYTESPNVICSENSDDFFPITGGMRTWEMKHTRAFKTKFKFLATSNNINIGFFIAKEARLQLALWVKLLGTEINTYSENTSNNIFPEGYYESSSTSIPNQALRLV